MIRRSPSVLLLAADGARADAIAAILSEAGIAVTAMRDGDPAVAAVTERFDLAIVVASLPAAVVGSAAVKRLRRARPGLEIMYVAEMPEAGGGDAAGFEARRIVGCVRERLAGGLGDGAATRTRRRAEFAIAEARICCLHQRAEAARGSAARDLAREIDYAIAQRDMLCREAAGAAG